MTRADEYRKALEWIKEEGWEAPDSVFKAVTRALRIAEMLEGEPTSGMKQAEEGEKQ